MSDFFRLNSEHKIAFKKLSDADLGLSSKSNQTHIGLFSNILSFLPDTHIEKAAMLIYNDYCDILSCEYGKINRKNGRIEAPKVQSGSRSKNTVVRKIRTFVKEKPHLDWFLIWFGTDSNELIFILLNSESQEIPFLNSIFNGFKVYDDSFPAFPTIVQFVEEKINNTSDNILKDLEIASQVGDIKGKFKAIDLEKAANRCKVIGRKGEELINEYLKDQKRQGKIVNFYWENKSKEVGKPYDFIINPSVSTEHFIDVKSTSFGFSQEIIYSENEISFIDDLHDDSKYFAYRVYDINTEKKKLSICNKCLTYFGRIDLKISHFQRELARRKALTKSLNIAVKPEVCFKKIGASILL